MKILYVTTISNTMDFFTSHIKKLFKEGHSIDMACKIVKPISNEILDMGCNVYNIDFNRSPLKVSNFISYKKIKKLILENGYDVVHTHTPIASACVRLACKDIKEVKVIYTAHGFHFFKGAPLLNWLLYYPIEKVCSYFTDFLITINKEDYILAKTKLKANKVKYIPGVGIDTVKFENIINHRDKKRIEIGIQKDEMMILSVGELNKNKNHEIIIKALANIGNKNIHYCIAGQGNLEQHLKKLAKELNIESNVHILGYRNDIGELCKISDIFCFPSFREGLPVSLMEAMSVGLPIICSNIRGNVDLIDGDIGGFLCNPTSVEEFEMAINYMIKDKKMRIRMGEHNRKVVKNFDSKIIEESVLKIYREIEFER